MANEKDQELTPLTEAEFELVKEEFRRLDRLRIENRPPPQGEYQWDGGLSFNGGFGSYQALYYNGKKIGGLFTDKPYTGEYRPFSEDGGVCKPCDPPVTHTPFAGMTI